MQWSFPGARFNAPVPLDTRGLDRLANVLREQQQQQREAEAAAQAAKYRQQRDMIGDQRADRSFGLQERQHADSQDYRKLQLAQDDRRFGAQQSYQNRQLSLQEQKLKAGGSVDFRNPVILQGGDGKYYSVQFGSDGSRKILPFDTGLAPSKGVTTVDEATGTRVINKTTGADVRQIPKNLAEAEKEKKVGAHQGESIANKTKASMGALSKISQGGSVFESIDLAIEGAKNFSATGLLGAATKDIPTSPANTLKNRLQTIKANIGFDKIQDMRDNSPTGGALGQVSNFELENLQAVWGSVEQSQTQAELVRNLNRFKATYRGSMRRIQTAYELTYGQGSWRALNGAYNASSPGEADPANTPVAASPAPIQSGVPDHPLLKKYGIE